MPDHAPGSSRTRGSHRGALSALLLALIGGLTACSAGLTLGAPSTAADTAAARGEIVAMMDSSAIAWNHGDLDAFMSYYRPGTGTTFIGRGTVLRGPQAIREVYAARFAPGGTRDSLSFQNLELDLLAPDVANVIAWYVLSRGDSVVARGPTSLVMRREHGGWRIVHDHSS